MTSGRFHLLDIDSIVVDREGRQRRELINIDVLADSIKRLGLIHPLVVTRDKALVSGERRFTAIKALGWTHVPVQYTDELDTAQLRAIELEENIKREDITWQDRVRSVREYHDLRKAEEPKWVQKDTAKALGLDQSYIAKLMMVAEEVDKGNDEIMQVPKLSVAVGRVQRQREREDAQVLESLTGRSDSEERPQQESILLADFNQWSRTHVSPKFNFIHCDFPYGIDADTFNQGGAAAHGGYTDSKETWQRLIESLNHTTRNHCTPSAHLMFWFAMRKGWERLYEPTVLALERMGWQINPLPLIWMKSDGVGIIPDPERGPRQIYETALFGSRGDRRIAHSVANAIAEPSIRDRHMSEKPERVLLHFFRMFVDENTVFLDPTCGSGSSLRAAEGLGAKYALGLEINPEFHERAAQALNRSRIKEAAE